MHRDNFPTHRIEYRWGSNEFISDDLVAERGGGVGGTVCRSTMFPDLYYSYETCGSPYDTAQSLGANLENRVLRAGMPTM